MNDDSAAPIIDWLIAKAPSNVAGIFTGLVEQLDRAGLRVWRLASASFVLHPENASTWYLWDRNEGLLQEPVTHAFLHQELAVGTSPIRDLVTGQFDELRVRLDREETRYSVLREMKASGATDYLLLLLEYAEHTRRGFISFAADNVDGFSERQLGILRAIRAALALRLSLASSMEATRGLLEVYLGHQAAKRVLAGSFLRGSGQQIRAVIFFCDLRGFTSLVDSTPVTEVIPVLDRYFDELARPVTEKGGEILKFIGDAMLAVFPVEKDATPAARAALTAAQEALERIEKVSAELRARGAPALKVGISLHLGEVMYGNIGASARLDFTVIGQAVNEVCRVESLCKELGRPLLVTRAFADACGDPALVSLGLHSLRGVSKPTELLTVGP